VYPLSGHWVWGGGWLANMGFHDFAGSGVVHMVGGFVGLVGAKMVGPRNGKFNADGTPNAMPPHNATYIVLGGLILFVGWFGFNAGSTLSGTDLRLSVIATNTMLAAIAGSTVMVYTSLARTGKVTLTGAVNGSLAGLVAITAPCAVVAPWAAVVIGALAAFVLKWSEGFIEKTLKIDDPVGAISVHGICGVWGTVAVGLFSTNADHSVGTQLLGTLSYAIFAFVFSFALASLVKATLGFRVDEEEEDEGLDLSEHGQPAYADFQHINN